MTRQLPAHLTKLSPRRAAFVQAYVEVGGNGSDAARLAGYSDTGRSASTKASQLLRDPKVAKALRAEIEHRFRAGAALAYSTLEDLARRGPPAQRLDAAKAILAHAGFLVAKVSEHNVTVTHEGLSNQELDARISQLIADLPADARARLLPSPLVVDAEFEAVTGPAEREARSAALKTAPEASQNGTADDALAFLDEATRDDE